MELFFWLVMIIVWVVSILAGEAKRKKRLEKHRLEGKPVSKKKDWLLDMLGIPQEEIPEYIPEELIRIQAKKRSEIERKRAERKTTPEVEKKTIAPKIYPVKPTVEEQLEKPTFDLSARDKLEEGIILSVILGPPKAYRFYVSPLGRLQS